MTLLAYFGHLNIDVTISVENIALKGSAAATGLSRQYGGTLGNFSMVAASLGLDFHPYSSVSPRSHGDYLDLLRKRGVDTSRLTIDENSEGPLCYIISDRKEQNAYMFQGPMDVWTPDSFFSGDNYDFVHFSSGPPDQYLKTAKRIKSRRVFDPSQELYYKYTEAQVIEFTRNCDIIMGNRQEIESILSITGTEMNDSRNGFDIVMTDGENGATAVTGGNTITVGALRQENVHDTIGAGDAFRAGFYSAIGRNMSMEESLAIGNITASLAISAPIPEFRYTWENINTLFLRYRDNLIN